VTAAASWIAQTSHLRSSETVQALSENVTMRGNCHMTVRKKNSDEAAPARWRDKQRLD
jgi:hypothetical protein